MKTTTFSLMAVLLATAPLYGQFFDDYSTDTTANYDQIGTAANSGDFTYQGAPDGNLLYNGVASPAWQTNVFLSNTYWHNGLDTYTIEGQIETDGFSLREFGLVLASDATADRAILLGLNGVASGVWTVSDSAVSSGSGFTAQYNVAVPGNSPFGLFTFDITVDRSGADLLITGSILHSGGNSATDDASVPVVNRTIVGLGNLGGNSIAGLDNFGWFGKQSGAQLAEYDNLDAPNAVIIPEPQTYVMAAGGLLTVAIAFLRRRLS